jgi:2-dehydropantoate 2-reductase
MRITVVGAGAVGGLMAGWIGRAAAPGELQLAAVARGATLQALRRDGLRLELPGAEFAAVPLQATDDAAALGAQDLVIVAVKGPALAQAAPVVAELCGPHTNVLVAMNGVPWWFFDGLPGPCANLHLESVDPGGTIRAAIPTARVLGCVVHLSSMAVAPGVIRHVNGRGLIVGEPGGGRSARLDALAALLVRAGFEVTRSERIQRDIWYKLWGNMTMNPVSALTGASCDRILDDPLVRAFISRVMLEAREICRRIGVPIDQEPEARHAVTRKLGAFKTSMLQDLEAGRPLEIDTLVGAVQDIGRHLQLPTPDIDALLGLVRLAAQTRGLYPSR